MQSLEDGTGEVIYFDGDRTTLRRPERPTDDEFGADAFGYLLDLKPFRVQALGGIDLHGYGTQTFDTIDEESGRHRAYFDLVEEANYASTSLPRGARRAGQFLGHPLGIDGDRREWAHEQLVDRTTRGERDLPTSAGDWSEFWRIDSNFDVGINIWDAGELHVMLPTGELDRWEFDRAAWCIESI